VCRCGQRSGRGTARRAGAGRACTLDSPLTSHLTCRRAPRPPSQRRAPADAIIWRGPRKNGLIRQFLSDVDWGTLDYLVIDTPPGTSDEHISIVQYLKGCPGLEGAVVVTTPQAVSLNDVRKELSFCKKTGCVSSSAHHAARENRRQRVGLFARTPVCCCLLSPQHRPPARPHPSALYPAAARSLRVLGVVENMSGFLCPCCGERSEIFPPSGAGPRGMADEFGVPFLGALPIDPLLLSSCESGEAYVTKHPDARGVPAFLSVVSGVVRAVEGPDATLTPASGAAAAAVTAPST
jgi:hypothetical protein